MVAQLAAPGEIAVLAWIVAGALVLLGVAGAVVPALPSSPLVFLGLLTAAWADHFQHVGWVSISVLALLALGALAIEIWATRRGARRFGSSPLAMIGATVGTVVGLFFSLPGLLLGPFAGAFAGEYLARRNLRQAGRAGLGAWFGMALAAATRLALVFAMIGIFIAAYLL